MKITLKNEIYYLIKNENIDFVYFDEEKKSIITKLKIKKNPFIFLNKNHRIFTINLIKQLSTSKQLIKNKKNIVNDIVGNFIVSMYLNKLYYICDGNLNYKSLFIININNKKINNLEKINFNFFFFFLILLLEYYKLFIFLFYYN